MSSTIMNSGDTEINEKQSWRKSQSPETETGKLDEVINAGIGVPRGIERPKGRSSKSYLLVIRKASQRNQFNQQMLFKHLNPCLDALRTFSLSGTG